jgi:hypothetical protein
MTYRYIITGSAHASLVREDGDDDLVIVAKMTTATLHADDRRPPLAETVARITALLNGELADSFYEFPDGFRLRRRGVTIMAYKAHDDGGVSLRWIDHLLPNRSPTYPGWELQHLKTVTVAEADALLSAAPQPAPEQPAPARPDVVRDVPVIVRRALEAGRDMHQSSLQTSTLHDWCSDALAALDQEPAGEAVLYGEVVLPEWAWVDDNGDMRIKLASQRMTQIIDHANAPIDLDRIGIACCTRAAQLRKEGK